MTGTEQKVFNIISNKKEVSVFEIAKELNISSDYTRLICQGLERHSYISVSGNYCSIISSRNFINKIPTAPCLSDKRLDQTDEEPRRPSPKGDRARAKRVPIWKKDKEKKAPSFLSGLKSVNRKTTRILKEAGYGNIKDIADTPFVKFMQSTGLNLGEAARILNEAKKKLGEFK